MAGTETSPATRRFTDYFGDLGPRWGLPSVPCRIHALLYLQSSPKTSAELQADLSLPPSELKDALQFLEEYGLVTGGDEEGWQTANDPWDMLITGLEKRRERELPDALKTMRLCWKEAQAEPATSTTARRQLEKMLMMVEDIAAIDAQAQKLSARRVRQIVGLTGKVARFFGSTGRR